MIRKFNPSRGGGRHQRGTSLIEVLISVLIMAVGLLGIAAMQATALRNSQSSTERSQAVIGTYAIIDAMRANRIGAIGGNYNTAGGWSCALPAAGTLAGNDVRAWMTGLRTSIGSGAADATVCGNITCDAATGVCLVGVQWDDSRGGGTGGTQAGATQHRIQTRVRM